MFDLHAVNGAIYVYLFCPHDTVQHNDPKSQPNDYQAAARGIILGFSQIPDNPEPPTIGLKWMICFHRCRILLADRFEPTKCFLAPDVTSTGTNNQFLARSQEKNRNT